MPVSPQAFLDIESSLADRLYSQWQKESRPLLRKIWASLEQGDTSSAIHLANGVNLDSLVEKNADYIDYLSTNAILFGATRVTPDPRKTTIPGGNFDDVLASSQHLLRSVIKYNVEDYLRFTLLEAIAAYDLQNPVTNFSAPDGPLADYVLKYDPITTKGGEGSGHHGHAGRPGERGGSAPGEGGGGSEESPQRRALQSMFSRLSQPDGGFTVQTATGAEPTRGFALSIYPDRSFAKAHSDLRLDDVYDFITKNDDLLARADHHLGGWHDPDTGKVFLDVSMITDDRALAEDLALKHDQIAYFSLAEGKSITVNREAQSGGAAKKGVSHGRGTERETDPHAFAWEEDAHAGGYGRVLQKADGARSDTGGTGAGAPEDGSTVKWDESKHPRNPSGSERGGEFSYADTAAEARATPEYKALAAAHEAAAKTLDQKRKALLDAKKAELVAKIADNPQFKALLDPATLDNMAVHMVFSDKDVLAAEGAAASKAYAQSEQFLIDYVAERAPPVSPFAEQANQVNPQTTTREFKAWFGDSKAVDENGNPLVAFHGTKDDIEEFNTRISQMPGATDRAGNDNWCGPLGTWFTAPSLHKGNYDPGNAESTAGEFSEGPEWMREDGITEGGVVYPVYLSLKNPKEFDGYEEFQDEHGKDMIAYRNQLIKQGHDGIVIRNSMTDGDADRDDWVAFHPEQIKSAIGNVGKFDPKSKHIAKWDESLHPRDEEGKFTVSGSQGDLPSVPGTLPIPEGHVRLYHQTGEAELQSIARTGLTLSHAQGIEGPRAIYAGETGFYGKPEDRPTLEFHVPKERWSVPFVRGDVTPEQMVAVHLPWHAHARYIEENPDALANVLEGRHDWLMDNPDSPEGKAIAYIKSRHAKKYDEELHPRDEQGRWTDSGGDTRSAGGTAYFKQSLGIKRKDMPQIAQSDLPEFTEWAGKQGVSVQLETENVSSLHPAQNEYNPANAAQLPPFALDKPLTISRDNYVLDGTNRWVRQRNDDPNQQVKVRRIDLPAKEALKLMLRFPKAFSKDVGDVGRVKKIDYDEWVYKYAWDESQHPRVPAGDPHGGEFTSVQEMFIEEQGDRYVFTNKPIAGLATVTNRLRGPYRDEARAAAEWVAARIYKTPISIEILSHPTLNAHGASSTSPDGERAQVLLNLKAIASGGVSKEIISEEVARVVIHELVHTYQRRMKMFHIDESENAVPYEKRPEEIHAKDLGDMLANQYMLETGRGSAMFNSKLYFERTIARIRAAWIEAKHGAKKWDEEDEEKHPRAPAGTPEGGQWSKQVRAGEFGSGITFDPVKKTWVHPKREVTEREIAVLKSFPVPPAWVNVHVNPDPTAPLQVLGQDAAERWQPKYSVEHTKAAAVAKFARGRDYNAIAPRVTEQIEKDLTDPDKVHEAAAMRLIQQTGIRIGGEKGEGVAHTAIGASTLKGQHVKIDGDKITLNFTGKSGVRQHHTITDPVLSSYLRGRGLEKGKLVFDTTDAKMREYFKNVTGDRKFLVKDVRMWVGTATAIKELKKVRQPKNEKEFKEMAKQVATKVSKILGNTPAMSLKSYIDPLVWQPWNAKFPNALEPKKKVKKSETLDEIQAINDEFYELVSFIEPIPYDWREMPETAYDPDDNDPDATHEDDGDDPLDLRKQVGEVEQKAETSRGAGAAQMVHPFVSFRELANNKAGQLLQLISGLHTSRLSAYGFTVEASVTGVSTYAISAQLDNRVCDVCAYLHGMEFQVEDAVDALRDILKADDPEDLRTLQPWPRQDEQNLNVMYEMTPEELVDRNWHIPPYHPNCRCLLVKVEDVHEIEATPSYRAAFPERFG